MDEGICIIILFKYWNLDTYTATRFGDLTILLKNAKDKKTKQTTAIRRAKPVAIRVTKLEKGNFLISTYCHLMQSLVVDFSCHFYFCIMSFYFKDALLHKKWSFPLRIFLVNRLNPQLPEDLVLFTEKIYDGKLHFCAVRVYEPVKFLWSKVLVSS